MTPQKKMYKVLSPMEKRGGGTYWMRVGSAFTNRDDSINVYLDAMPPPNIKSQRFELQIRELNEEDLRRRDSYASASSASSSSSSGLGLSAGSLSNAHPNMPPDLGGVGGGPTFDSRAVTARAGASHDQDVPF